MSSASWVFADRTGLVDKLSVVNIHFPPTDAILNPVNLLQAAVSRIRKSRFGLAQTVCKQTVQIRKPVSDSV